MDEKTELRNIYKTRRNGMSRHEVEALSAQICAHLTGSDLFREAQYLYAYYPLGSEADVRLVAQAAWQEGKRVAFPKVFGDGMRFFEVTDFGQLAEGAFGVMEPARTAGAFPADWHHDLLVLFPGVAFDRMGNRMGHGKGYYDRFFAAYGAASPGVTFVGVAYESQVTDHLPTDPHDLTVQYLVTEEGIFCTGT